MTTLISTQALQLETPHGVLFQDLSFTLRLGDRIGLTGHNGSGKSTLLNLLSGKRTAGAGAGSVQTARLCRLQYVEQQLPPQLSALSLHQALLEAIADQPELHWRVDSLLQELDLDACAGVPVADLSGGQHTRLLLGRALLQEPNLLLLDEPSNHLDLPALLWLERFLLKWKGAFVLVSHDQRLLDNVTRKSWILRDQRLYCYDLPCGQAMQALAESDLGAAARRAAEQKEIDRLATSSQRLALWGRTYDNEDLARKAKTMQKRVERLTGQQTVVSAGTPWHLSLHGQEMAANQLLAFQGLAVSAAPELPPLFQIDQLWLRPGDKIALLGANGSGKSSLLRLCWHAIRNATTSANLYVHPSASIGYYDQSLQQLDDHAGLPEALYPFASQSETGRTEIARRQALISAGFPYGRHSQTVATLSGGERARLLFLALSLAKYHLLLLDEPTNHLDMQGKRELAQALSAFQGGVLLVSHDRDLIEQSCRQFWVVHQGRLECWLDAGAAYRRLLDNAVPGCQQEQQQPPAITGNADPECDPDLLLARVCKLEQLLAQDMARKERHQKPGQQQQWRSEIAQLYRQLETLM